MAGTGLINEALDDLRTTLATLTGIPIVRDVRNITPGCVLIGAPSFTAWNGNIVHLEVPCTVISSGPGNQDALDQLLSIVASVLGKNVAVTDGRPTSVNIGGVDAPAYDLTIKMQAQTA
jgi:hypothetical protein